jgi:hypothetical protein
MSPEFTERCREVANQRGEDGLVIAAKWVEQLAGIAT